MINPILHVRTSVLNLTQAALAELTGTKQATVSRWERGELYPDLRHLARIRQEIRSRGLAWDDSIFFEPPKEAAE
ncbi:XRE family transcriptional regulator [Georhizobium profundi]|uniref:XRE family transcriptional regulator n=1 Tax=Georhizobium profundi TaxID=2341112 RepID=A0A3Q8XP51_9HYPH|nr:helix-turn-helix transcriptional regulator [Georhizobium profundi]AZN71988.1 XRE family transcriptional regulator [Georhizobium profundi]